MSKSMTRMIAAVAAGFVVAVVLAGLVVTVGRAADVAGGQAGGVATSGAQRATAESAYMYVDFADDFQSPRQTALGWRSSGAAWRVSRGPGGDGFMRYRDCGAGALLAAHGQPMLAANFTMYVDIRVTDVGGEAGLTWGVREDRSWRAVISGAPAARARLRVVRAQAGKESELANVALPPPRKGAGAASAADSWRVGIVSARGQFSVTVGDQYLAQARWGQGNRPGPLGLWSRGAGEFDNFVLQARPAQPGIIAVARLDGRSNINIYVGSAGGREGIFHSHRLGANYYPTWSPDAKRIVFQSDGGQGSKQGIFLAGGPPNKIGKAPQDQVIAQGPYAHPAWSPTGEVIAFDAVTSHAGHNDIHDVMVMKPDGSGRKNIINNRADDVSPAWSPDGRKLAFCSDRSGGLDIFVANADGSNPVNITKTPGVLETDPAWSPDGGRIAFCAADSADAPSAGGAPSALYVMSASGGDRQLIYLSARADALTPSWSPDGEKIAFTARQGENYAILIANADGSNVFRAFASPPAATPAWRPAQPQAEPQLAAASVWASPGATVSLPILIQGLKGVRSATIEVAWDGAAATLKRAVAGDAVAGEKWMLDAKIGSGAATLKLRSSGAPAWRDSGALAELEFAVLASARPGSYLPVEIRSVTLAIAGLQPQPKLWQGGVQVVAAAR